MRLRRSRFQLPPRRLAEATASPGPGPVYFRLPPADLAQVHSQEYSVAATELAGVLRSADARRGMDKLTGLGADVVRRREITTFVALLAPPPGQPGAPVILAHGNHRVVVACEQQRELPVELHLPAPSAHYPGAWTYPTWGYVSDEPDVEAG